MIAYELSGSAYSKVRVWDVMDSIGPVGYYRRDCYLAEICF